MSIQVTIVPGSPVPIAAGDNVGCIIARVSGWDGEGIIEEIRSTSDLEDANFSDAGSYTTGGASELYRAVDSFLAGAMDGGASGLPITVCIVDAYPTAVIRAASPTTWAFGVLEAELPELPVSAVDASYLKIGSAFVLQSGTAASENSVLTGDVAFTQWDREAGVAMVESDVVGGKLDGVWDIEGVYFDYALTNLQAALRALSEHSVNFVAYAQEATETGMANPSPYTGSTLAADYLQLRAHCANAFNIGKPRMMLAPLPAGVAAIDNDTGFGLTATTTFGEWMDVTGGMTVIPIAHDVGLDSGIAAQDPGPYMMGLICSTPRLKDGFLLRPLNTFSQTAFPTGGQVEAWKRGQIGVVHKKPHVFTEKMLTAGYTFGSNPYDRVETVRCALWVKKHLEIAGWTALARNLRTDYDGCKKLKSMIDEVGRRGANIGACDGFTEVRFPLLAAHRQAGTAAADATIAQAKSTKSFGTIQVKWELYPIAEWITMTVELNR